MTTHLKYRERPYTISRRLPAGKCVLRVDGVDQFALPCDGYVRFLITDGGDTCTLCTEITPTRTFVSYTLTIDNRHRLRARKEGQIVGVGEFVKGESIRMCDWIAELPLSVNLFVQSKPRLSGMMPLLSPLRRVITTYLPLVHWTP